MPAVEFEFSERFYQMVSCPSSNISCFHLIYLPRIHNGALTTDNRHSNQSGCLISKTYLLRTCPRKVSSA
jgi:hypothetical protein